MPNKWVYVEYVNEWATQHTQLISSYYLTVCILFLVYFESISYALCIHNCFQKWFGWRRSRRRTEQSNTIYWNSIEPTLFLSNKWFRLNKNEPRETHSCGREWRKITRITAIAIISRVSVYVSVFCHAWWSSSPCSSGWLWVWVWLWYRTEKNRGE